MSIPDVIMEMPWWYIVMLILLSLYYAIRGILEQQYIITRNNKELNYAQRLIISYIQEFLFKFIITTSGFLALFVANHIFLSLESFTDIGLGTATLLIFLIVWGVTGMSGYLTFLIVRGKFPSLK